MLNSSFSFEGKLAEIFRDILETYNNIESRIKAEQFKQKVLCIFRAWEDWAIYPNDLLIKLQNVFLGLISIEKVSYPNYLFRYVSDSQHISCNIKNVCTMVLLKI